MQLCLKYLYAPSGPYKVLFYVAINYNSMAVLNSRKQPPQALIFICRIFIKSEHAQGQSSDSARLY